MNTLREMAEDAALHNLVGDLVREQYRSQPIPTAPDVRPAADELGPIPAIRPAVEAACIPLAIAGIAVGLFFT